MPTATYSRRFIIVDDHTVREARDRQEERAERRPKKRQRKELDSDEDEDHPDAPPKDPSRRKRSIFEQSKAPAERDAVYWNEEDRANCHLRVDDTLFKIHRELLSCSEFMVELLQDHEKQSGPTAEDNPLHLVFCNVEEFRAFLWALYATVDELGLPPDNQDYVDRLFLIAEMVFKYDVPKLEDWVFATLRSVANNDVYMESCSSAALTRFLELSIKCNKSATTAAIVSKWVERLWNKSTPSTPAILASDRHNLELLRGPAYYVHLLDMHDRQGSPTAYGATHLRMDEKLNTNAPVLRLLGGYWSLVNLWERTRLEPIDLPPAGSCCASSSSNGSQPPMATEAHVKCVAAWERRWISAAGWRRILGVSSPDILGLLACLRDQLMNDDDLKATLNPACRLAGLEALKALRTKMQEGLADHFVGVV